LVFFRIFWWGVFLGEGVEETEGVFVAEEADGVCGEGSAHAGDVAAVEGFYSFGGVEFFGNVVKVFVFSFAWKKSVGLNGGF
jgi:hypothetical protein